MNKKNTRIGSVIILSIIIALFLTSCIVTTNLNVGHHLVIEKDVRAEDVLLDQAYDISGNRR